MLCNSHDGSMYIRYYEYKTSYPIKIATLRINLERLDIFLNFNFHF